MGKPIILLLAFFALVQYGYSQEALASDSTKSKPVQKEVKSSPPSNSKEILDTNESIKYMGSKLWFQMKKRLNLTSKEEEIKNSKKVVLTFGGLKVEG